MRLTVHGLDVRAPGDQPLLKAVDFTVDAGAWLTLVGPSGLGKSTLLRTLVGLADIPARGTVSIQPTSEPNSASNSASNSEVVLAGTPSWPAWRRRVTYIGQTPSFRAGPVWEHLAHPFSYAAAGARFDAQYARAALVRLNVGHVWDQEARTLSGGEAQRVHLVRALLHRPEFVLLDEPSSALDPANVDALRGYLEELRAEGLGVLVVTHDTRLLGEDASALDVATFLDPARESFRLDGGDGEDT